jgi:hypothetical protein
VSKRRDSVYRPGRSPLCIECRDSCIKGVGAAAQMSSPPPDSAEQLVAR